MGRFLTILDLNDFSILMQNIGLAVVTILIPFAIAIIINILQNQNLQNNDFIDLDMHVTLDHLFRFKKLPLYLGLIFLPPLFWGVCIHLLRVIIIVLWGFGIILTFIMLFDLYGWIKGNKKDFRFSYLEKLENSNEMKIVWKSVWSSKNINYPNDRKYLEIFKSKIDNRIIICDLETIYSLLSALVYNIKNRIPTVLTLPDGILPKLLEWHYVFWKKEQESIANGNEIKFPDYGDIVYGEIDPALADIHQIFLHKKRNRFYFKAVEKHINSISEKPYLEHLFQDFFPILFELENDSIASDIWHYCFPQNWKVTEINILDKNNIISKLSLQAFIRWAPDRIIYGKDEYDKKLELVARELFPDVDSCDWAIILMIAFFGGRKLEWIIEKNWNFGKVSVVRSEDNAIKLSFLLFDQFLSIEKLEKYIEDLKLLKYDEGSIYDIHGKELQRIIDKMVSIKKGASIKLG
jgi:hypothetical protein